MHEPDHLRQESPDCTASPSAERGDKGAAGARLPKTEAFVVARD